MLADCAQGMPAARSASFIDGLSRQSQAVRTDVPGIPQASRTFAAGMMCASTVASMRSTHTCRCTCRTASRSEGSCTTEPICRYSVSQFLSSSSSAASGRSPMPITRAPTAASARTNCRWLCGNAGSTKMTCIGNPSAADGQAVVQRHVFANLAFPGKILREAITHDAVPAAPVLKEIDGGRDGPDHGFDIVVVEEDARALAGMRIVELHRVREPAGPAHDGNGPIAQAVHLVETAG